MKLGLAIFPTDEGPHPADVARLAERLGFESLFVPEHTHIPASRRSPHPAGGELPREYSRTLDPFVALSSAATATSRLAVGTGLCLLAQRDPIIAAKEVASLDWISDGRFLFGVGGGWNVEEMENHGVPGDRRFAVLKEKVAAVKEIWANDEASFTGRSTSFEAIRCRPRPIQGPHPPILIGGNGPAAEGRVRAYGNEWAPVARPGLEDRIAAFLDSGPGDLGQPLAVTVFGVEPEHVATYAEAGAHRCVFWLPPRGQGEIEARAETLAELLPPP